MKVKAIFPAIVASFLVLTGCQWDNNNMNPTDENGNSIEDTRSSRNNNEFTQNVENRNRFNVNENRNDNDSRYEVSDEAAKRIVDEIDEIDQAYVLTTENNAYVAATLDRNDDNNRSRIDNDGRNRTGNNTGMINRNSTDRATRDYDMDKAKRDRDINRSNQSSEFDRNITTNVRDFDNNDELSDEIKQKIARIVKDVDGDIDNVYVSTSPDFFSLTNDYVSDFQNGRPVEGFFEQMGNMIERIFPENQSDRNMENRNNRNMNR